MQNLQRWNGFADRFFRKHPDQSDAKSIFYSDLVIAWALVFTLETVGYVLMQYAPQTKYYYVGNATLASVYVAVMMFWRSHHVLVKGFVVLYAVDVLVQCAGLLLHFSPYPGAIYNAVNDGVLLLKIAFLLWVSWFRAAAGKWLTECSKYGHLCTMLALLVPASYLGQYFFTWEYKYKALVGILPLLALSALARQEKKKDEERMASEAKLTAELRAAKALLQRNNDALASASHDLAHSLSSAIYQGNSIVAALEGPDGIAAAKEAARDLVSNLYELHKDLVDTVHLGKLATEIETIATRPISALLLRRIVSIEFGGFAMDACIRFRVNTRDIVLRSDERVLLRILRNLIFNAIDNTVPNGYVRVLLRPAKGGAAWCAVEVWDTGVIHHFNDFEAFRQHHIAIARARGGRVGMGLGIAQRFARCIGTEITLRARPKGGSVFRFTIPILPGMTDDDLPAEPHLDFAG